MGDKDLKVTDKRMFTADGRLREEYRHLESDAEPAAAEAPEAVAPQGESEPEPAAPRAEPEPAPATPDGSREPLAETVAEPQPSSSPPPPPPQAVDEGAESPTSPEESPRLEIPGTPEGLGAPTFLDLVTLLAEPIALYLGDAKLPGGESAENLEMARLHIDLLDVLRRKTAGNLEVGESRLLEDLLYRCRLRYVQKRD